MVPRPRTATGKNATISVKVSDEDDDAIRARCAALGITRSAWLQGLIAADLSGIRDAGTARVLTSTGVPPVTFRTGAVTRTDCTHPKARVHKGLCGACGTGGL